VKTAEQVTRPSAPIDARPRWLKPVHAGDRGDEDRQRVERAVAQRVAAGDREGRQREDVDPQQRDDRAVARLEGDSRKRAARRQPGPRPTSVSAVWWHQHVPDIGHGPANLRGGPELARRTCSLSWG
jgi:hypothetical protein